MANHLVANSLRDTARWRELKAEDYPDDDRNLACARALYRLADYIEALPAEDELLQRLNEVDFGDTMTFGENAGSYASRIGFNNSPRSPAGTPRQQLATLVALMEEDEVEEIRESDDRILLDCARGERGWRRALMVLPILRSKLQECEEEAVYTARDEGASWATIAAALGVKTQTVWEKYHGQNDPPPDKQDDQGLVFTNP